MSVTREELAAFADGELDDAREAEIAAAVAADPALARQVEAHRALKARLASHFAPIVEAPLPERITAPLQARYESEVVDFSTARDKRERTRRIPRWSWIAGPAVAASLALAILLPRGPDAHYADGGLGEVLEGQLVATQTRNASPRILLSFRDDAGSYCRAFASASNSGIACRDDTGWRLVFEADGIAAQPGEYKKAGNPAAQVLERAQAMAAGPALDAQEERSARQSGWR